LITSNADWQCCSSTIAGPPLDGWGDAPFTFVTEGVEAAVKQASEQAGDGVVGVACASVVRQCLNAGILDAVRGSLVPYLIGEGSPTSPGLRRLR
jgi:dihydrofolate reductase